MIGLQDNFTFNSRPDAAERSRHTTTCPPFDVPFDEMKRLATRPISGKAAWSHHAASSSPFVKPCTFQNNRRCVTKNERSFHLSDLKGTSSFNGKSIGDEKETSFHLSDLNGTSSFN